MYADAQTYLQALQQLLPPGAVWPREDGAVLTGLLGAFAEGAARIDRRMDDLLEESDPRSALEMLPDWETFVGLPDLCVGMPETLAQRRAAVVARLTARGGNSRAYFINLAKALGFEITITEYGPFTCESGCDDPLGDEDWRFVWQVNAPATTFFEFTCESPCDEPLRAWGNAALECAITRRKPAHTTVVFRYGET